jgi:hypothetical protein
MSRDRMGAPHLIPGSSIDMRAEPLRRMPLDQRGSGINEAWLQRLIDATPAVLPVTDVFARATGPMISLGREIPVPTGSIDNLILTSSGHLVVVETKLWRNPQARREVVAQILDYAGHVRAWDYERLDALWRAGGHAGSLYEAAAPEEDEAAWVDSVNERLAAGEMLLLVVGDGIESRAETLADVVGGRPDLQFRLALVELKIYRLDDGGTLVVPSTLARTAEIERATVRVTYGTGERPEVQVSVPSPVISRASKSGTRSTLDAQALIAEIERSGPTGVTAGRVVGRLLELLDEHSEDLIVEWKSSGFAVKTPDPITEGAMLSLLVVSRPNALYSHSPWLYGQIERSWGDQAAAARLRDRLAAEMNGLGGRLTHSGQMVTTNLSDLAGREQDIVGRLLEVVAEVRRAADMRRG